jgi:hypothetical protein
MKSDEKNTKRLFRRGNVLDIAIILILIAAIATVGYRYYQSTGADQAGDMKNVVVTYRVEKAPEAVAQAIKQNDTFYLDSTGGELGIALDVSAEENSIFEVTAIEATTKNDSGETVTVTLPVVNLSGGMICRGTIGEDGSFLLDGHTPITPGQHLTVHTETVTLTLTVEALSTWQK